MFKLKLKVLKSGLVLLIFLAGCAQPTLMVKPGATQADIAKDKAQCDYETSAATQTTDYGYRTIFGQELDRALRKRELMQKCLIARGYIPQQR